MLLVYSFHLLIILGLVNAAKPRVSTAWKYAKVEMKPPGPSEWKTATAEFGQVVKSVSTGRFLQQTTKVNLYLMLFIVHRIELMDVDLK